MIGSRIQLRRDTAANWSSNNPVLLAGEMGYDTTNGLLKIGDGTTAWASLGGYFGAPAYVRAGSDQTVNNSSTVADDAALTLPVVANGVYRLDAHIINDASTTADFKFNVSAPSGATFDGVVNGLVSSATGSSGSVNELALTAGQNATVGGAGTSTVVRPSGLVVVSSTAGNVKIQWAQGTATVEDTHRKAGSWLMLTRLV